MATDALTPFLGLTKPVVGDEAGEDLWGDKLNANFDLIDTYLQTSGGVSEAPLDGKIYGRQSGAWTESLTRADYDTEQAAQDAVIDTKIDDAPVDTKPYARKDGAWFDLSADLVVDWTEVQGKPATFPPTLPIPSSGVTGLDTKQASQDAAIAAINWSSLSGKPATFPPSAHSHPTSEVTGLDAALAAKEPTITAGTTSQYWRGDKTWQTTPVSFPEAPTDGSSYARRGSDASWQAVAVAATAVSLNPSDKAADLTLSNSNYTVVRDATNPGGTNQRGVRATLARSTGKWVFAIDPVSVAGSTAGFWGLAAAAQSLTATPLNSTNAAVGSFNGDLWTGSATQPFGAPTLAATQTEVQMAVDLDANKIWTRIGNGAWSNSGDPAAGTGGYSLGGNAASAAVFPCFFSNTAGDSLIFNFGQAPFQNALPSGFKPWNDGAGLGNPVLEAPMDGNWYARRSGGWADIAALLSVVPSPLKIILADPVDPTKKVMIQAGASGIGAGATDRAITYPTAFKTGTTPFVFVSNTLAPSAYNVIGVGGTSSTATGFTAFRRYGGNPAGSAGVAGNAIFNTIDASFYWLAIGEA